MPSRSAATLRFADIRSATIRKVAFSISGSDVAMHSTTHWRSSPVKKQLS
jgi:hypothetical protein